VAPQKKIEGLKRQTQNMIGDNVEYKGIIEKLDVKFHKISSGINEMKKSAV